MEIVPAHDEEDTSVIESSLIAEKAHQWIIKQCATSGQLDAVMGILFQQHMNFKTYKYLLDADMI